MQLVVIRDPGALRALAPAWDALATDRATPMLTRRWAESAAQAFAADARLEVMVLGEPSAPGVIAPLARRVGDPLGRLEVLGAQELGEPVDLLHRSPGDLTAFAEALQTLGRPLFLKRIFADSPTIAALTPASPATGVALTRPAGATPWIDLVDEAAEPEARLDAGRRSDLRRARRRAEALGVVELEVGAPSPAGLGALYEEALRVEASGWKGREGSALAQDRRRGAFLRAYAAAAAEEGALRTGILRIGGRAAAMLIGTAHARRLWVLKMGYDERFRACSPGMLLLLEVVRHAMREGLRAVELLGFAEPWTRAWTRRARPAVALRLYPARARGLLALAADLARAGSSRVGGRFAPWR